MTTPTGPISLGNVQAEFGGANPVGISEYYRGGARVPIGTAAGTSGVQISTAGAIRLGDFRGVSNSAPAAPVNPLPNMQVTDFELSPTDAIASFTFTTNGNITVVGNGSSVGGGWYLPLTGGIGSSHWIRVTKTFGDDNTSGEALGVWLQLNANRTWQWAETSSVGQKEALITIEISTSSGGSPVVASRSGITCSVETN